MPRSAATSAVLTYHRIGDPRRGPPGIVSATRKAFEQQMRWLAGTGRAVSLDDVLRARDGGAPLPCGAVLVTFDDAYSDFDEHAWPVLRWLGIPVALFVPTAYPGSPGRAFWWDRLFAAIDAARGTIATPLGSLPLHAAWQRRRTYRALREHIKSLPHDAAMALVDELVNALAAPAAHGAVLSWPALRRLAREGVALGAHSRTHPLLSRVPEQRVATEIAGSVEDLHRETGGIPSAFAFPGGAVPPGADRVLRAAGIRLAFTTSAGVTAPDAPDWLALRRINIGRRTGRTALRARLAVRPQATAPVASPAAPARVAYVMSRFPKLTETFVLGEILALERRGVRSRPLPAAPRARSGRASRGGATRRARAVPALPVAGDRGEPARLAAAPAGRVPASLARRAGRDMGQPELLRRRDRLLPEGGPRGAAHGGRGRHPRPLPLRQPSRCRRPHRPPAHGDPVQLHRPRLGPARGPSDARATRWPRRRSWRPSRTTTAG